MPLGGAAVALDQRDARLDEQRAHAFALDVAADQRVQHRRAAEADEPERLAGGGRAERLVLVERELHVRHRLGQVVEQHEPPPPCVVG